MVILNYIKQIIKIKVKYAYGYYKTYKSKVLCKLDKEQQYVFIFFAADYNNLGDIAITYAQEEYIKKSIGESHTIIKVPVSQTYSWIKEIKKLERKQVLITLVGGGNNGTLYEFIEEPRRFVLKCLRNYRIISFPQTAVYEKEPYAHPYEKEFIKLCLRCSDLTLVAREMKSYYFYKKIKGINALLTPDIVFSFNVKEKKKKREGIAFIMRNDKEKMLSNDLQEMFIGIAKNIYSSVYFWDTCDIEYEKNNVRNLIDSYCNKLETVQISVTDRLHGMILCYITNTPCIVIDNNNGKIKETFKTWLINQNFIRMFNPKDGVEQYRILLGELTKLTSIKKEDLNSKFQLLENALLNQM